MRRLADWIDRGVGSCVDAGKWLALPVVLLLSAQWPLRDLVRCCSREANDLGQWLFALFIAVAVTAATRAGTHLRADFWAKRFEPRTRRLLNAAGAGLLAAPWSIFILVVSWRDAWRSLVALERFPETNNPGYFLIKLAVVVLAALVATQALVELMRAFDADEDQA